MPDLHSSRQDGSIAMMVSDWGRGTQREKVERYQAHFD